MEDGFNHELMGRIGPLSVVDIVGTVALGFGVGYVTGISYPKAIAGTFLVGFIVHEMAGIKTPVTEFVNKQFI